MKKNLFILLTMVCVSCQQQLEATTENINAIFDSKDFTIEFFLDNDRKESMSFIEDIIVYKRDGDVVRRSISYDEALLINEFIQNQFKNHHPNNEEIPSIIILNTAKKVTLKIPDYEKDYKHLIDKLDL